MIELRESVASLPKFNSLLSASFILYVLSLLIIGFSYQSYEPLLIINFYFLFFILVTSLLSGKNNLDDFSSTILIFSICLFWTAISSIYLNVFDDSQYKGQDSGFFLELAQGAVFINPNIFGSNFYDGIGAVNFWKLFYDLFYLAGFSKLPYIGVTINTIFVSLSGLFSLKMVKLLYPSDPKRYFRFLILFSSCGLFMLFASLHLRDAFVLFFVTLQSYGWIRFIRYKNSSNFFLLFFITVICSYTLFWLRAEFTALGFGFLAAFLGSFILTNQLSRISQLFLYSLSAFIGITVVILLLNYTSVISDLVDSSINYSKVGAEASGGSLGYELIISQPLPIRIFLSSIFLFILPVPFWSGMEENSIYYLFKSLNAVYFYFIIPLIVLSFINFLSFKGLRNTENYFLLFCILGFTTVVAFTSVESRHIGSFIPLFLLFCLIPGFNKTIEKKNYLTLLLLFVCLIILIHTAWIFIKYL